MSITFCPRLTADDFTDGDVDEALPSVNLSNSNAYMILRSLGIEADYSGSITPTDLLIAIACADPIDSGSPAIRSQRPGHPLMIEAAIRPNYHAEVYRELQEIARWCHENNRDIQWA